MSNWEYKVITSGKGGFASPALLEKFLNDLGQEEWEIIHFHTQPDNALAFTGLVRRSTQRDWTLEDAAAAAARQEADKLRAEFEAKFKAASGQPGQPAEDAAEVFLADERPGSDDGFRRPVDTSRDQDPDAPADDESEKDEWDKLAEEDELPTFFDALRPHMRRNQRGPGMSVGVDYLAKKWKLDEADIKGALVECGLQIPADENAKPVYVEFEGELFWVNINRRGEIWINMREKPEPVFRIVQGKRLTEEEAPADSTGREERRESRHEGRSESRHEGRSESRAESRPAAAPAASGGESASAASGSASSATPAAPKSFLAKIRTMMRRNRRGHGWSGSFGYLTKALKTDEAGLLAQLADHGLKLKADGDEKPVFHEEGDFLYWMDKNQRGEIWINARKGRGAPKSDDDSGEGESAGADHADAPESGREPGTSALADTAESAAQEVVPVVADAASAAPSSERVAAHPLEALRLLLQPKKRGDGVAATVDDLAARLERPAIEVLEALVRCGLNIPDDPKTKPTFAEHGGEIFWLNRNAKGELWLNAKEARSAGKRSRSRGRKGDETDGGGDTGSESAGD